MNKDLVTERLKLKDLYPERAEALAKEHDINIDDLELVKKGVISEKIETVEHERAVISFINMETVDRDNEIIDPDGAVLTHYNKVVPYGHDYRGLPMGKSMWVKKATKKGKKGLLAKTLFLERPPINEELYHMFTDDIAGTGPAMNSWSIGFIPLKWEDLERKGEPKEGEVDTRPRRRYTKWELLEYSGVMIPSCREALTEMVAKGVIKSDKLKKDIGELIEIEDDLAKEVVDKIEETEEFIRIPAKGEEGKHKGHKIRWITVSAKEGIRGIYCITCKKIITYVFMKDKGWTLEKAKKWMEDHGKEVTEFINHWQDLVIQEGEADMGDGNYEAMEEQIGFILGEGKAKYNCECISCGHKLTSDKHCKDLQCSKCGGQMRRTERPGPGQESVDEGMIELVEKGVIPFKETPKAPEGEKWDGPREVREAEVSDLKVMCCWFDSENPDIKGSYKLPHHKAKGHAVVWRAVAAAMAALLGARGGVDVPSGDRKGIYSHLTRHYKQFDKTPPKFREYSPEDLICIDVWIKDAKVYKEAIKGSSDEMALWYDTIRALQEEPTEREQQITRELFDRLTEQLNKVEEELKSLKEGRVLSEKNRKLIQDVLAGMEAAMPPLKSLLTATEPPKQVELDLEIEESKKEPKKAEADKLEIDNEALVEKIESVLKGNIENLITARINKLRGKVE